MAKYLSTKEAGRRLGLEQREVIRRIRRGEIPARKFDWIWIIEEGDLETVRNSGWYQKAKSRTEESETAAVS